MKKLHDEKEHQLWMDSLLRKARILEHNFPVKGESGWLPYGFSIAHDLIKIFESSFEKIGFSEIGLPTFVKGEIFLEQCKQIKDFSGRVYWSSPFEKDDYHVVKPTIEAQISKLFGLWTGQGKELPYKYYTCRSVGRYETGRTIPLWKERNVWPFFEAHSAHHNNKDFLETINQEAEILKTVLTELNIPVFIIQRPKIGKRLKEYSERRVEAISITPYRGVTILSSIYDLGEIFSKVYEIKSERGEYYPMVNFAFSGRLLGTVFSVNCDQFGLKLPLCIAPFAARITTINSGSADQAKYATKIKNSLERNGITADTDFSDQSFKKRIDFTKRQGIPLIILIGKDEVIGRKVTILRRDTGERVVVSEKQFVEKTKSALDGYHRNLITLKEQLIENLYTKWVV